MVKKINSKEFNELQNEFIVLDFYADWCGPCKMTAPILEEVSNEAIFNKISFCKVNVDEEDELAMKFGIQAIPTLVILKNKAEIARKMGFTPKVGLVNWIKDAIK